MSVWHKADEEKPKIDPNYPYESVNVLALCYDDFYIAYYVFRTNKWILFDSNCVAYGITHWTELPELPKAEEY